MRRLFWIFVGAGLGLYGRHKAKLTVDRYVPPAVTHTVTRGLKSFLIDVVRAQEDARRYLNERRRNN